MIIYGGGNTAMDAARTVRRLGADEALIVYRRDRAHMPARAFEADEALSEGIKIKWLTTIKDITGTELTVEVMELDTGGHPQPTDQFETLAGRGRSIPSTHLSAARPITQTRSSRPARRSTPSMPRCLRSCSRS